MSWPSCLTCIGWFSHINGHPSAADRAQDRESSPAETDVLPLSYATNLYVELSLYGVVASDQAVLGASSPGGGYDRINWTLLRITYTKHTAVVRTS